LLHKRLVEQAPLSINQKVGLFVIAKAAEVYTSQPSELFAFSYSAFVSLMTRTKDFTSQRWPLNQATIMTARVVPMLEHAVDLAESRTPILCSFLQGYYENVLDDYEPVKSINSDEVIDPIQKRRMLVGGAGIAMMQLDEWLNDCAQEAIELANTAAE
jgi:hypothetical protein